MQIGDRVCVRGSNGVVRFFGPTEFAPGKWVGVELDTATGKNDGSVEGHRYFECQPAHGVFVRESAVGESNPSSRASSTRTPVSNLPMLRSRPSTPLNRSATLSPLSPGGSAGGSNEVAHLHKIIDKLQAKLKKATDEIKAFQATESSARRDSATANERNQLQKTLNELQLRYDDLKADHALLQEEVELNKQLEEEIKSQMATDTEWSHVDVVAILARNSQLEGTVVDLEKIISDNDTRFTKELNALRQQLVAAEGGSQDELRAQLEEAEQTIATLHTQLELSMDSEPLVEQLTAKNEALAAQITQMTQTIDELTEIHELDKSLEENQLAVEESLRKDIRGLQDVIRRDQSTITELERRNKYMEATVVKLRAGDDRETSMSFADASMAATASQVDDLQLHLKKAKLEHRVEKFRGVLAASRLANVHKRVELMQRASDSLKPVLDRVYTVIGYGDTTRAVGGAVAEDPSVSPLVGHCLASLSKFLGLLQRVVEYNDDIAGMDEVLKMLEPHLEQATQAVPKHTLSSIDVSFVPQFIEQSIEVLSASRAVLSNRMVTEFFVHLVSTEKDIYTDLVNQLRRHVAVATTETSITDVEADLKRVSEVLLVLDHEVTQRQATLDENADTDTNVPFSPLELVKSWRMSIHALSALLPIVHHTASSILEPSSEEIVDSLVNNQRAHDAVGTLSSIHEAYKGALGHTIDIYEVNLPPSIYHQIETQSRSSRSPAPLGDASVLQEKERQIQDYKLNIDMLEANMRQLDTQRSERIRKLDTEVTALKSELEDSEERLQSAADRNKQLEGEIQALVAANSLYDVRQFDTIQEEEAHITHLRMREEMGVLRKLVAIKFNNFQTLDLPALPARVKAAEPSRKAVALREAAGALRAIPLEPLALPQSTKWQPLAQRPLYRYQVMQHQFDTYVRMTETL
ncbi:hypothetical protein DICA3_F16402 [Diutina catenulata]